MRRSLLRAAAAGGVLLFSSHAHAQTRGGQVEGFGGMTVGTTISAPTFGASVAFPLGDTFQIIGEAGRIEDVKSGLLDFVDDLTPFDVRLGAWYGEGGIRFIASPRSPIRPYAEATAGVARVSPRIRGAGALGAVMNTGLDFLASTQPVLGVGAGVILQGGPVIVDAGYRFKQISSGDAIASALALEDGAIEVNQIRFGIGFRF